MPKHYCDYCDVFLTHDSTSVRKAHNSGRNHLSNVRDYYASLGHDKAQSIIDQITSAFESGQGPPPGGFGFGPQHLAAPPPSTGYRGPPGYPQPPFPGMPPPGFGGMPPPAAFLGGPPPQAAFIGGGPPPFPPNGGIPPQGFNNGPPPFTPPFPPNASTQQPGGQGDFSGPPPSSGGSGGNPNPTPGGIHPDRLRMMAGRP